MLFENGLADHLGGHLLLSWKIRCERKSTVIIHWRINRQTVFATELIVLQAMSGGDVHKSGARCIVNESIPCEELSGAVTKWMLVLELAEMVSIEAANNL